MFGCAQLEWFAWCAPPVWFTYHYIWCFRQCGLHRVFGVYHGLTGVVCMSSVGGQLCAVSSIYGALLLCAVSCQFGLHVHVWGMAFKCHGGRSPARQISYPGTPAESAADLWGGSDKACQGLREDTLAIGCVQGTDRTSRGHRTRQPKESKKHAGLATASSSGWHVATVSLGSALSTTRETGCPHVRLIVMPGGKACLLRW